MDSKYMHQHRKHHHIDHGNVQQMPKREQPLVGCELTNARDPNEIEPNQTLCMAKSSRALSRRPSEYIGEMFHGHLEHMVFASSDLCKDLYES